MASQRDLRARKYPLLERIERMKQKEERFEDSPISLRTPVQPIGNIGNGTKMNGKHFFTKLRLLKNKRRDR